jgi:hypothetical protein
MCVKGLIQEVDIKIIILAVSMILSNGVTIFLYLKNRQVAFDNLLSERLFRIQDISFNNPFLEDDKFIDEWDSFCDTYRNKITDKYNDSETKKYLQYEQYCEMLFNLIAETYENTKSEKEILKKVAFKDWARVHSKWWKKPLDKLSNQDSYDMKTVNMIDRWVS